MANIDDKVVAMSFDNKKFEEGVKTTISSLDKLKNSLSFQNAGKGLENVSRGLGHFQLAGISNGVSQISSRLNMLRLTAIGVFANIATSAVQAGASMVKAFTIGPIIQGLQIYQTKLQAIQTIMANTQAAGTKMGEVTAALDELNRYSNLTIYSFGEMTRNIGTFTAAGVALKPAVAAIKGIANLAALSGSNSQQASTAMYQLSQALSAGRVSLQDWNSVVNAGMGGAVFQRALVQTAVAMGKIKDSSVKLVGPMKNVKVAGESFRQSIQAGPGKTSWLTSDVLTTALSTFTGDMNDAQLAAKGFSKEQIKMIQKQAKAALDAATQVKTFSQLMEVSKETIATGWSTSFELIVGDLNEAKKLWTGVSNVISGIATKSAKARNKMLSDWKGLGGRELLIDALSSAWKTLSSILGTVGKAFREVFPRTTGLQLAVLTDRFKNFVDSLKPSPQTLINLQRTFAGVFAVLDIGKQIIMEAVHVFQKLFGVLFSGTGSFLGFTAKIGDFFVALDKSIKKGDGLTQFFEGLGKILAAPLHMLGQIGKALGNMFSGFSPGGFSVNMDFMGKTTKVLHKAVDALADAFQGLGSAFANAIQNINWDTILAVVRTGLFAGIFLMVRKFIGGTTLEKTLGLFGGKLGKGFAKNLAGGVFQKLGPAFGSVTGSLNAMQKKLQAQTLEAIAIAIALLAGSLFVLSLIKPKRLNSAMGAITLMFLELIGAMKVMEKVQMSRRLPLITAGMIGLAIALDLLTIAIFALSKLSWSELTKGLTGIGVTLGLLVKATESLSKNAPGMIRAGIGIGAIAIGLDLMATAVQKFGKMDLKTMGKGLLGVTGALIAISVAMQKMPKGMVLQGAALILIAEALTKLGGAVQKFGNMNLQIIGKGLLGIGGGLVVIAGAMHLMPKNMILMSAGLLLVATSLDKIVSAVGKMGKMSLKTLATGIGSLAGSLLVLAAGLQAMTGTISGAIALGVAAGALSLLVPALISLGHQSWTSIIKGLIGLGGAMAVIGLAGTAMTASVPALLGFGAALLLIGGGIALVGAGIFLIGTGLSAIAVSGTAAVGILLSAIENLAKSIPELAKNIILGVLEIVKMLAKTAPQFVEAIVKIGESLLDAIIKLSPKLAEAAAVLLESILESFAKHSPDIVQAGFQIIINLLKGIRENIVQVTNIGIEIVIGFLQALTNKMNKFVTAGANFIFSLLIGIGNHMVKLTGAGIRVIEKFIEGLGIGMKNIAISAGKAVVTFLDGIAVAATSMSKAFVRTAGAIINAIVNALLGLEDKMATGIIKFLNGTARILEKRTPEIRRAFIHIGMAIADGMTLGLASKAVGFAKTLKEKFIDGPKNMLSGAIGWLTHSPSKWTTQLGIHIVQGLIDGIEGTSSKAVNSVSNLSKTLKEALTNISFSDFADLNPTIRPVLDLSSIERDAGKLGNLIGKKSIGTVSLDQASVIASQKTKLELASADSANAGGTTITLEQNNYSPKALSEIEIYRNTRNQLSQLKSITVPG